jgi:hypothetical protein
VALGEALDKLDVQNNGGGLKRFAKHSCAKIRRGAYVATLAIADAEGAYFETNDVLGASKILRRQSFASVALLDATDERDGSSLGEARELALGFLRRRGDDAWRDLRSFLLTEKSKAREGDAPGDEGDEPLDSIDAFLGVLERHVSSGCHGAAEQSAPSVLPLLAATPLRALREKKPTGSAAGRPVGRVRAVRRSVALGGREGVTAGVSRDSAVWCDRRRS